MKSYNLIERRRIHRRAKAKLGLKADTQSRDDFIEQCIIEVMAEDSAAGTDDARSICETMWEEDEQDLGEFA